MPENDSHDKLTLTLDALRSDVERTPLADSLTVRRRGDQRTRRQAVGGAVAVVAVVAGLAGVLGGGGFDEADRPTPATQNPTDSTSVDSLLTLASDPLLPADSPLLTVGRFTYQRSPDQNPDVTQSKLQCMPDPTTLGAAQTVSGQYFSDVEGGFTESVLRFDNRADAVATSSRLQLAFQNCPKGDPTEVTSNDRGPDPAQGLEGGFHASRESVPTADAGIGYNELGVAVDRNVVVVLYFNGMGNPAEEGASSPASAWVFSDETLTGALEAATA